MGHRALVAYERDDGYALHYSHWGATDLGLVSAITPATPFGLDDPERRVDPAPIATGLAFDAVLADHLDFLAYEAFYVVGDDGTATAYLPLWFGLAADDHLGEHEGSEAAPTVGNGALVAVDGSGVEPADPDRVRGWFEGATAVLSLLVERDTVPAADAHTTLETALRQWFDRREVLVVTPD